MSEKYTHIVFAIAGGLAAFTSLVVPFLWPLSLVGLTIYFSVVRKSTSNMEAVVASLLFGLLASMGGVWWFFDALPLSWLGVPESFVQPFLVGIVFGLTSISLALPFAFLGAIVRNIPAHWYRPIALALLYAATEELRLWSFSLFFLAPESLLAPDFSIAALGYTLVQSSVLLPVAQAGILGLNILLGLLAALLLERRRTILCGGIMLTLVALICAHAVLPSERAVRAVRIALMSTYAPPGAFLNPALVTGLLQNVPDETQIIVVPEGLGLAPFMDATERQIFYKNTLREGVLVLSSSVVRKDTDEWAELIYETPEDGVVGSQRKMFFVPVGEYLPPLIQAAVSVVGKEALQGYGQHIDGTIIRGDVLTSVTHKDTVIGALLCSELLSPRLYRKLARTNKTDLLVNVANNSWFHGSRLLHARLQQVAKTHALSNRQPLLVASNGSPSYAVDARGRITHESSWGATEILLATIPLPE